MIRRIMYWLRFRQRAYERGYVEGWDAADKLNFVRIMNAFNGIY